MKTEITFNNTKSLFAIAMIATLTLSISGCSGMKSADQQDLSKMSVHTEERKPTAEELLKARELTETQAPTLNTFSLKPEAKSTIAGMDEIIGLANKYGKVFGPKGAMIAEVGQAAWKLLEGNQAQVSLDNSNRISLLPCNVDSKTQKCIAADWRRMSGFNAPRVRAFSVIMKNPYGMKVVKYDYAIAFDYGGSVDGRGQYLMNLTVINSNVDVMWGFNLDAEFVAHEPTNAGTAENPIPAITGEVRWKVKNILTNVRHSNAFWAAGDGRFQDLSQSDSEDTGKQN